MILRLFSNPMEVLFDTFLILFLYQNAWNQQVVLFRNYFIEWRFSFFGKVKRSFRNYCRSRHFELNFWTEGEKQSEKGEKRVVTWHKIVNNLINYLFKNGKCITILNRFNNYPCQFCAFMFINGSVNVSESFALVEQWIWEPP